jgi:hypothetical protein
LNLAYISDSRPFVGRYCSTHLEIHPREMSLSSNNEWLILRGKFGSHFKSRTSLVTCLCTKISLRKSFQREYIKSFSLTILCAFILHTSQAKKPHASAEATKSGFGHYVFSNFVVYTNLSQTQL